MIGILANYFYKNQAGPANALSTKKLISAFEYTPLFLQNEKKRPCLPDNFRHNVMCPAPRT